MNTILWVVAAVASVSVVFSVAVVALAMRGAGRPTLEERYKRAWATYVRDTDAFPRCPAIGQHSRTDDGMEYNVKAGDRLQVRHGPFLADTWWSKSPIAERSSTTPARSRSWATRAWCQRQMEPRCPRHQRRASSGVRTLPPGRCLASTSGRPMMSSQHLPGHGVGYG